MCIDIDIDTYIDTYICILTRTAASEFRVCGGLSSTLGLARCGRSAGCVLCAMWAVSAAVFGGVTLWG